MVDELGRLKSAVSDFEAEADFDFVDPKQLAAVIDRLQGALCKVLDRGRQRRDHRLAGLSPASWSAPCSTACTRSTACSTRSPGPPSGPRSTPSPGGGGPGTPATRASTWPTPWPSCSTTT